MTVILVPQAHHSNIDHILFATTKKELQALLDEGTLQKEEIYQTVRSEKVAVRLAKKLLQDHKSTKPFPTIIANPYYSITYP